MCVCVVLSTLLKVSYTNLYININNYKILCNRNSTNIKNDIYLTLFLCMSKQLKAKDYESEKGSAEDELNDSVAKYAKIRPMRVEMFLYAYKKHLRGF